MIINTRFFLLLSLAVLGLGLVGCETMEGAGRDIGKAGQSIENAAD